ncbi:hypothetical protein [Geobacter sp. AOG2]|uniref:hypothetical protein n=1 Tax=Geobacter sp. AOG2 TaxID=1566347 RepID=UPI001CC5FF89|nr:hypothetical protein [Geobacter sp. AOG2]GFE61934.1 hypothetical protein AOG2_25220 [Geobacter sp. AOG2]
MAIALVAGSKNRSDAAWGNTYHSSVSCAFSANVSAGNLLVACIDHGDGNSNSLSGVTDSLGQTWTKATEYWDATLRQGTAIYYKYNTLGGSNTVSANFSGSTANWITLQVCEFSGVLNTGDPLDQKTSVKVSGSATPSVGPITPAQNGELLVAMCGDIDGDSSSLVINSPFSEIGRLAGADTCGYYVPATAAAISAGFTANVSVTAADLCMASFKPSAGGGGGTTYNQSVAGSFPAPSGSPAKRVFKVLAGSAPAPGGVIARKTNKGVTGGLPAPGGAFASRSVGKGVAGVLPSPAGAASSNGAFGETLAGNFPAPSGSINKQTGKQLAGAVPAAGGTAVKQSFKALTGNMPSAGGNLGHGAILHQSIAGIMGTISGAVSAVVNPLAAAAKSLRKIIGSGFKKIIGG